MIHLQGIQAVSFRVLVVSSETIERGILARCIAMLGWTADTASGPDEAISEYSLRPHNFVVLDLAMGRADTETVLRRLRRGPAEPTVIFIAGLGDRTHFGAARLARELGLRVAGTLARPVDPYGLHAMLLSNPARGSGERRTASRFPSASDLEQALLDGEIHTEYQPKIELSTGEIVGVEALARWRSPTFGRIPPEQFVPVAEQSDLISRLTFHVLADALAACARWRAARPNCSVAVNISPRVLADPLLLPTVDAVLGQHGLPPEALIAEVTEPALLSNLPAATEILTRLRIRGVGVSIDDFGTGCSSVPSLLRLPFSELKIDRSFVGVCQTDPDAWKLVRVTLSLARELEMRVVAEGVETEDVSDRLRDAGCDTAQGWHFGRPMQEAAMLRRLTPMTAAATA